MKVGLAMSEVHPLDEPEAEVRAAVFALLSDNNQLDDDVDKMVSRLEAIYDFILNGPNEVL